MLRELYIYKWPSENYESESKYANRPRQGMVKEKGKAEGGSRGTYGDRETRDWRRETGGDTGRQSRREARTRRDYSFRKVV